MPETFYHTNQKNPHVSVVIPALNEEKYLPGVLKSLCQQTYKDFEILVVNNHSTDKTAEIAQKYGATVLLEKTIGVSDARQKGALHAIGEIVVSTDADAVVPADWLTRIVKAFEKDPAMVAYGGIGILNSGPKVAKYISEHFYMVFTQFDRVVSGGFNLSGFNMAFRKSAFDKVGGYDSNLTMAEDIDLSKKLRRVGKLVFDQRLAVKISGRRYEKNGFIRTIITTYGPNMLWRVVFRKYKSFNFTPVR